MTNLETFTLSDARNSETVTQALKTHADRVALAGGDQFPFGNVVFGALYGPGVAAGLLSSGHWYVYGKRAEGAPGDYVAHGETITGATRAIVNYASQTTP